ncbi:uncharacterized protein N7511_011471 [Penicillium nucicola]|uniref:uncharacterized protein n=1 Tax=Penicillium nucicola TaxID=1850975 RepID=UPI0025459C7D|nr:uncharacterized protein N7511_011471 [Penicillium nucicola]KAJ5742452.1 hypothetical protein N7511_011471 [Penicillium nucicola]
MSSLGERNELEVSVEDDLNAIHGYKGALNNPKVTDKAKHHAADIIGNETGWSPPLHRFSGAFGDHCRD